MTSACRGCARGLWICLWLCLVAPVGATTNRPGDIPNLRPPKPELPPSFWEEHGVVVVIGAPLTLMLLGVVVWLAARPRPLPLPAPAVTARRALETLRGKPEDGKLLSLVSRLVKQYLASTFGLPHDEATTPEFRRQLQNQAGVGEELAAAASDFLTRCDEHKFAPAPPAEAPGAVEHALKLIAQAESRLAATPPKPSPPPGS